MIDLPTISLKAQRAALELPKVERMISIIHWQASSESLRGFFYNVYLVPVGEDDYAWECDCPAGSNGRHCKHVVRVAVASEGTGRPHFEARYPKLVKAAPVALADETLDDVTDFGDYEFPISNADFATQMAQQSAADDLLAAQAAGRVLTTVEILDALDALQRTREEIIQSGKQALDDLLADETPADQGIRAAAWDAFAADELLARQAAGETLTTVEILDVLVPLKRSRDEITQRGSQAYSDLFTDAA